MRHAGIICLNILFFLSLAMVVSCTSDKLSADEKSKVQGTMKEYVDDKLAKNGNVYKIEDKSGVFDFLHEGVKKNGDMNVSCADVKVGNDVYDIDYYVQNENGKYTVMKEVLHKINKEEINRTIWEKE
jgi:RNA binding exosome subunit